MHERRTAIEERSVENYLGAYLRKWFLNTLLEEGLPEPELYGDLIYKFRKGVDKTDFKLQI